MVGVDLSVLYPSIKNSSSVEVSTTNFIAEYRKISEMRTRRSADNFDSASCITFDRVPALSRPVSVYKVDPKTGQKIPVHFSVKPFSPSDPLLSPCSPSCSTSSPPTTPATPQRKRTRSSGKSFTMELATIHEETPQSGPN
eukprot:Sdes_comp22134_c0_seq1m20656